MDSLILIILSGLMIVGLVAVTVLCFKLIGLFAIPLAIYTGIAAVQYVFLILGTIGVI